MCRLTQVAVAESAVCLCVRCRCNLAGVMLQLMALGIPDVANFDFMSKPSPGKVTAQQLMMNCCTVVVTQQD